MDSWLSRLARTSETTQITTCRDIVLYVRGHDTRDYDDEPGHVLPDDDHQPELHSPRPGTCHVKLE